MTTAENPVAAQGRPEPWPMSLEAYHLLGEAGLIPKNTELIRGVVYPKMSKSPYHSALMRELARLLRAACPPGYLVDTEQPITCDDSEPEPDIFLVRGKEEDFWRSHPKTAELVIEVCVSRQECSEKIGIYAKAGVKEVWVALWPQKQIEVFCEPYGDEFKERTVHGPRGILKSRVLPAFSVDLERLFAK